MKNILVILRSVVLGFLLSSVLFTHAWAFKGYKRFDYGIGFENVPDACVGDPRFLTKTPEELGAEKQPAYQLRSIDGPANLRDAPDGKLIASFPNHFDVLVEARKGQWYYVRGYNTRTCENGWTHEKNLRPAPPPKNILDQQEKALVDSLEDILIGKCNEKHKTITLKKDCTCIGHYFMDGGSADEVELFKLKEGNELGKDCNLCKTGASKCESIYCPKDCIEAKDTQKLTIKARKAFLEAEGSRIKKSLMPTVPAILLNAVSSKFPHWSPVIFTNRNEYFIKVDTYLSTLNAEFLEHDLKKKRSAIIFYANSEDVEKTVPTIAFEGNDGVKFQKFPFIIEDKKLDPLKEICFVMRSSFVKVIAVTWDARNAALDGGPSIYPMADQSFLVELSNTKNFQINKSEFEKIQREHESGLNGLIFTPPESIQVSCFKQVSDS